jgi:HEAT repeat protein
VRAIPGLLRALHYYGGEIVPTHVIGIGEEALEVLLGFLNSEDRTLRNESYGVLSGWVNAPVKAEDYAITKGMAIKDKQTLDRIKVAFLKALNDKDMDVRSAAVYGLAAFPDETVIKSLEEVAKSDPYSFYSKYENKVKYPIREDAKRTIEKIRNKMTKGAQGDK